MPPSTAPARCARVSSQVPQDVVLQLCGAYSEAELSPPGPALSELRRAHAAGVSLSVYMEESVQELLRDAAERFKGWTTVPGPQHTELACKKVSTTLPAIAPSQPHSDWGRVALLQSCPLPPVPTPVAYRHRTSTRCVCGRHPRRWRHPRLWCCTAFCGSGPSGMRTCCGPRCWSP